MRLDIQRGTGINPYQQQQHALVADNDHWVTSPIHPERTCTCMPTRTSQARRSTDKMLNPCDRATVQAVRWLVGGKSCATYRLGGGGRGAAGVRTLRYDCVELSPTEPHHMWVIDESARGILAQGRQILLTTRFQVARQRQGEGGGGCAAVRSLPCTDSTGPGGSSFTDRNRRQSHPSLNHEMEGHLFPATAPPRPGLCGSEAPGGRCGDSGVAQYGHRTPTPGTSLQDHHDYTQPALP
eukprot:CAMPEP_0174322220 /NCGR_PEP_ID=MMETSP0810-20121108/10872_1 /TAXON_ID=73025 ORGANISM="Eutreptiella gymnastica-like, Strain CCMP1594" /NCGR_SAMPLE_ID=MMETSP0810 /ASSEMBLY_ACC=CAM_ASM_000659 /LENGTH=238 /DNA_ID=CAMNT_0015433995 /DNA_START=23 /DNA_END=737 /DNA_ORIENTATION=-